MSPPTDDTQIPRAAGQLAQVAAKAHERGHDEMCEAALHRLIMLGPNSLFAACYGWARFAAAVYVDRCPCGCDTGPDTHYGMEILGRDEGQVDPDALPDCYGPAVWAARVITAAANRDLDGAWALFTASGPTAAAIYALLDLTVDAMRQPRTT